MSTLTISRCPIVVRHDFPDEMMNYIDEKMDEGQYKKRFRYDRPDKKKSKQTKSILNMNSQEIFQKIVMGKKEPKEERFRIKPKQKINTTALHSALLKVKKQKEELDICLAIADKAKQCVNENDICMLANEGAVKFIMSQNLDIDEAALLKTKKGNTFHPKPKKSQSVKQVIMDEPENLLSIEGRSYNMAVSTSLCKNRPTSAFSTMRPVSSTKNYSEKGISEHLLQQYADFRNELFEKLVDNNENQQNEEVQINVGYPNYLTTAIGMKGSRVPPGFLPKGLKRIHSAAATQNVEFRPFMNPGEILFNDQQHVVAKRPQTAMISKIQSTSRLNDHLKVIEEVRHQEDLSQLKISLDQSFKEQQQTLNVTGKKRIQSAYPKTRI
ncbi:unnamed protein product [Paramecium sonneborni]|uniref:Uncharacterized protein n=1 Tax=Paramecium sonneborni TaxID=65129 RepID=A0A8S1KJN3_9CILI|nr:unnamed protein product [Paramecium sonneborni]